MLHLLALTPLGWLLTWFGVWQFFNKSTVCAGTVWDLFTAPTFAMGALLKSFYQLTIFSSFLCLSSLGPLNVLTTYVMHGCLRDCTSPLPDFLSDPDPDPLDRNEMLWSAFAAMWWNLRRAEVMQLLCKIRVYLRTGEMDWRSKVKVMRNKVRVSRWRCTIFSLWWWWNNHWLNHLEWDGMGLFHLEQYITVVISLLQCF